MHLSESDILEYIRHVFAGGTKLTDDCGRLPSPPPGETLLVTTDLMESGQHFQLEWHPPKMLGRKLLASNLSDLDSSGAVPLGFTLTLAVGKDIDATFLEQVLEGLAEGAKDYNIAIIGGDTVGRQTGLGLGMAAFGATKRWLRRSGVAEGDNIYVDALPGASHRGLNKLKAGLRWDPSAPDPDILAHLDPKPQIGLGAKLAAIPQIHACIDISDGLSKDLRMLAEASGLSIVVGPGLDSDSLFGGEDYSRCFACNIDAESLQKLTGQHFHYIARAVSRAEAPLLLYTGTSILPLEDGSFEHFRTQGLEVGNGPNAM
ncbi:MAG: AIR synthase related protein [Holophagaceae bacterium]|nr:AIR synthase related protein [Holophagaceae bacterium]